MKRGFCEKAREKNPTLEERTPGRGKWGGGAGRLAEEGRGTRARA